MKKINKITLISFLLFILITILVITNKITFIDDFIYRSIINLKSDNMTNIMKMITFLGSIEFNIIIIFILLILSIFKGKKPSIIIFLIIGSAALNFISKNIFMRIRPNILQLVSESSYSYPSGHTMASTTLCGILIYLILKNNINKKYKIILSIILSIIPILVMLSRIYLGVHYFSDVMGGLFLSLTYLTISLTILERKKII